MPEILNRISVQKPIEEVFRFASSFANWPRWHPTTISVVNIGNQFIETVRFGLLKGRILWTLGKTDPPCQLTFHGVADLPLLKGSTATITYQLTDQGGSTLFERRLNYSTPAGLATLIDRIFLESHNRKQSEKALRQFKKLLEAEVAL